MTWIRSVTTAGAGSVIWWNGDRAAIWWPGDARMVIEDHAGNDPQGYEVPFVIESQADAEHYLEWEAR